ncbi:uncharacterized protein LOC124451894 [Xenia sp. Carnegie-2017]|uniref:uncharacterized protein LOC124451894 n=1 Tax=Xenia sp. Carnegie-2017 TaxID=2897299 RepID=UPI001F03416A|nr:uncharacterized protein LOC124451894 [Xenia sp. Carnegie-2017]
MSSFISTILKSTVGVICNKIRDKTAENLKDGDVTDAKLREFVVGDLNDIKTKLDGLSRKDLLSSYDFFKQGIHLLLDCIENSAQLKEGQQFNMKFGKTYHMALDWPTIQLKNKQFNPILNWREISKRNSWDSKVPGPNELELKWDIEIRHLHCNSSYDFIYCDLERNLLNIMRKDADDEVVYKFPLSDVIEASFIDKNDDMYIIVQRETSSNFHLVVLDPYLLVKSEISLDLTYEDFCRFHLFVPAENIVVYDELNKCVFVCDLQGKLIKQFTVELIGNRMQRIVVTNENEIILGDCLSLYIYSMEGCLKSKVNLHIHFFIDFFYHFGLKKFLIIEYCGDNSRIHSCDHSGKLETLTDLKDISNEGFLSSSSVPVVSCSSRRTSSVYLMWC